MPGMTVPLSFFILRPVATTLLTFGLAAAGAVAFFKLPVSPLPQVDFPTISIEAKLPGASAQDMAATVASPLERHLTQIANVAEMTSVSTIGWTRIVMQFGLDRDINGAARDVQAAINGARADLPTSLRTNPTYHKVNPADAPILILTLTSDTASRSNLYDAASTTLAQKLAQVEGVGQVELGGSSLPAVRVDLIPQALYKYGIGLEDVRAALSSTNAHSPKGGIEVRDKRYQIYSNDQASNPDAYKSLILAYRNGAPVRLSDVGEVTDGVENVRNAGLANGKPAVVIILYRQPGANIVSTVDSVKALLPLLRASVSASIDLGIALDSSTTIRTSLQEVERTLIIAVLLVIFVVFIFLRNARATLIPLIAVSVSLIGTFAIMYLFGYSLDTISLTALTVATGFLVDDAIVVVENISRYIELGMAPFESALKGANEVSLTVLSMSISLIAVFIPILLMGDIVGRVFREFAMVISISILISLAMAFTNTPMMCAVLLRKRAGDYGKLYRASEHLFEMMLRFYERTLTSTLENSRLMILAQAAVLGLNFYLYDVIPKGFFPQQDTGRVFVFIEADQGTSFQFMQEKLAQCLSIIKNDPAVETAVGFIGDQKNAGFGFASLYPLSKRKVGVDAVTTRLRRELLVVPGATAFVGGMQDISVGGRASNARYQYTLQGPSLDELIEWSQKIVAALQRESTLAEVNSDLKNGALEFRLAIDRDAAARLGITVGQIDNTLYDAFGQRQVSTIYLDRSQYHVIMEVAPRFWQNPETLRDVYISTSGASVSGSQATNAVAGTVVSQATTMVAVAANAQAARNLANNSIGQTGNGVVSTGSAVSTSPETMIPLSAVASFTEGAALLSVNHQGLLAATTISFNLLPHVSLSTAVATIEAVMNRIGVPATIRGSFQGTAKAFLDSLAKQPYLIVAALVTIYIVLGVLYESYIHPLTVLSTLPSAGVGALLTLMAFDTEFSVMALIGVILLMGIVVKNAIMMIDFALEAERKRGLSSIDAIREACLLRFRPIMMTTMAAVLGAFPLAFSFGEGSELRQPLGISIIGGLVLSQALTLYSTPVIYLYLNSFRFRRS
ncbi:efflux RND transporter permease subunit [Bradyrhizobium sp.]|uniref:efflux RND transporter permease subunit n=1 Tax=Bradyrhizobium sp. TaxID=376 RepID=UPI003C6FD63D